MGISNNPYTPWLACLRRPDEPSPKRTTDYQFYMRHDDYKKAVDDEFKFRHWDEPRHNHLALRCKIAREMFDREPEEVKDRIRKEALEEHEEEKQQWKDAEEGLPSADEEDQKE
jgi:predicted restriction endonuclease